MSPFLELTLHLDVAPGDFYLPASPPPSPSLSPRCSFRWAHLRAYAFTVPSRWNSSPPSHFLVAYSLPAQITAQIHPVREAFLITIENSCPSVTVHAMYPAFSLFRAFVVT